MAAMPRSIFALRFIGCSFPRIRTNVRPCSPAPRNPARLGGYRPSYRSMDAQVRAEKPKGELSPCRGKAATKLLTTLANPKAVQARGQAWECTAFRRSASTWV